MIEGYDIIEQHVHNETGQGLIIYTRVGINYNSIELKNICCKYCCIEVMCKAGKLA